ncbi:MAG: right-handed parallel beta-helix repeat-containing protein [Thermomicrobiales bacterium]
MDTSAVYQHTRRAGRLVTRRVVARALSLGAALASLAVVTDGSPTVAAKKRRVRGEHNLRGKKAIMCIEGETRRVPKKQRKKYLKRGATRGECTGCTPVCAPGTCGSDGCGGTCSCTAGSVCANETCQTCTVTCASSQTPAECGDILSGAIDAGGTVYVCPGLYDAEYDVAGSVTVAVYGAGPGTDPTTSSILRPAGSTRVMRIRPLATVTLVGLRLTGGNSTVSPASGGGIRVSDDGGGGANLTLENCAVSGNSVTGGGGGAMRIYDDSVVVIRGCEIVGNTSTNNTGGAMDSDGDVTITDTLIAENEGTWGGGIYSDDGTVTMAPSVTVTRNHATSGGGGFYEEGGTIIPNGAAIFDNTPDNCDGDDPVTC